MMKYLKLIILSFYAISAITCGDKVADAGQANKKFPKTYNETTNGRKKMLFADEVNPEDNSTLDIKAKALGTLVLEGSPINFDQRARSILGIENGIEINKNQVSAIIKKAFTDFVDFALKSKNTNLIKKAFLNFQRLPFFDDFLNSADAKTLLDRLPMFDSAFINGYKLFNLILNESGSEEFDAKASQILEADKNGFIENRAAAFDIINLALNNFFDNYGKTITPSKFYLTMTTFQRLDFFGNIFQKFLQENANELEKLSDKLSDGNRAKFLKILSEEKQKIYKLEYNEIITKFEEFEKLLDPKNTSREDVVNLRKLSNELLDLCSKMKNDQSVTIDTIYDTILKFKNKNELVTRQYKNNRSIFSKIRDWWNNMDKNDPTDRLNSALRDYVPNVVIRP